MLKTNINRTSQLRVRLTNDERDALESLIAKRGKGETISDVIRDSLSWCLKPGQQKEPYYITPALRERLNAMAKDLNRKPDQVIESCIQGILDLIEKPNRKLPLIVLELQLRTKYQSQKDKKVKV
jgi:hypothetical protein